MSNKEWTIMIYLAGDNNLSVDMAYAMEQIKGIAGEEANGTNLFVYYDGNSESIPTLYCDFSDSANPRHVRSFKVPNKLYRVEPKRNENAADYRSVLNFVDWCVNKVEVDTGGTVRRGRRADKYGLIFSGHSLGFNDPGLFKDETSGKSMKMEDMFLLVDRLVSNKDELNGKIHDLDLEYEKEHRFDSDPDADRRRSTVLLGQPLDILGFDSCVMGMLEVGYQYKKTAKTMIASEGSVPSAGWTYAKILGSLARDMTPLDDNEVAARFVTRFIKSQDSFTVGGASVDMAAWDMAKLDGLNTEFDKLANVLFECFDDPRSSIYRHMERALLQVHWKCQSYMLDQNVDIGDFCELLRAECVSLVADLSSDDALTLNKVQEACDRVLNELNNVVILSGFSGGEYQYSNGISLFFPWSYVTYMASEKYYKRLEFVEKGAGRSWSKFLRRYLSEVTLRPFEDPEVSVPQRTLAAASGATASISTSKHRYMSFRYNEDERSLGLGNQIDSKFGNESGTKLGNESGTKFGSESGTKLGNESGTKFGSESGTKLGNESGTKFGSESGTKLGNESGTKFGSESGTKLGNESGTKFGSESGTKLGNESGTKFGSESGTKLGNESGTKFGSESGTKLGNESGTKFGSESGTKLGNESGTKFGSESGTKLGNESGTKMGNESGTKFAGESGTKLSGGGPNALFNSLRLFKNIESRWNISGFTKTPAESEPAQNADATHG